MRHFGQVCSRVARFFKPTSQVTFPEVRSKRCVQRGVFKEVCWTHLWKCYFKSDLELFPKLWLEITPQISERVPFLLLTKIPRDTKFVVPQKCRDIKNTCFLCTYVYVRTVSVYSTYVGPGWSQTADVKKPNFFSWEKNTSAVKCIYFFPFREKWAWKLCIGMEEENGAWREMLFLGI